MFRSVPRIILSLTLCVIMAVPANLFGQESASGIPPVTIRANTRLVMVDVVIRDKKGQPVTGLKAEDFTVEENGKKQKVSVFVPPGAANATQATPAPPGVLSNHPENVGPGGVPTVLLLDATNSPFKDQAYGRSQMLKYVLEHSQGEHPVAIFALLDQVHVLQQFTSDPQVLMAAIKNYRPQEQILQPAGPAPASRAASIGTDRPGGGGNFAAGAIGAMQAAVQTFANMQVSYDLERRTEITIEAMRALSRILGGLPGRKNVVWLTASLPFDLIPEDRSMTEDELRATLPSQGRQRSVSVVEKGTYAAQARLVHGQDIKEAESRLASANVAIYPVDLRGLMVSGIDVATTGTMEEVAAETGGKAYTNQNEIKIGIALATSDEKASYSLGYYPENKKWDGKYRSIKIKVARGDTELRHRKGYFALDPAATKNVNFEQDVAAALGIGAPATQVSFMAQAKPTDPGKMRVVFLVDAHTISAEDSGGNRKLNVSMYASLYDAAGKNLGTRSIKVDKAFDAATYQQIVDKGMMVPIDIDLLTGAKELRLAVLDNKTGFIGTASGPLD